MRVLPLLAFAGVGLVLSSAGSAYQQDSAKDDRARLQGEWAIVSVQIEGQTLTMDQLKEARLVIQGKKYSFKLGDTRLELTYQMDAGKTPRTIDLRVVEGAEKGKVYLGIYKFENDQYKICRATTPEGSRPGEFVTRPGSGHMMVVWKRGAAIK